MIDPSAQYVARGADFHILLEPTDESSTAHACLQSHLGHGNWLGQRRFNSIKQGV